LPTVHEGNLRWTEVLGEGTPALHPDLMLGHRQPRPGPTTLPGANPTTAARRFARQIFDNFFTSWWQNGYPGQWTRSHPSVGYTGARSKLKRPLFVARGWPVHCLR